MAARLFDILMKTIRRLWNWGQGLGLCLGILAFGASGFAQNTGSGIPVVTIEATVPVASGPGNPGVFTLFRSGATNELLNVFYLIGGTAANGVAYAPISNWAAIPAGAASSTITITPILHSSVTATQTVTLQLASSPEMNPVGMPVNFSIGWPSNATVTILPELPPTVTLASPTNGQVFYAPATLALMAQATDPEGTVTNVEFFAGTNNLGRGLPVVLDPLPGGGGIVGLVYFLNWLNVPAGPYSLTTVATDNNGVSAVSAPVSVTVLPAPTPTNLPPVVRITSPANGSVFRAPVNLPLYAFAADPDGFVTSVEFFAGTNSLGLGQPVQAVPPPLPPGQVQPPILVVLSNYWELVWTNSPAGANTALTAKATDNGGAAAVSAPVQVSILPAPVPPTNRPAVVSIVATDPVAIEGTNCWSWPGLTNTPPAWSNWVTASTALLPRFTNCGPKDATFTVTRSGATNEELNVSYLIGGTASNGVDYVLLTNVVTLPAGGSRAQITLVPLDDGPPDANKTVILTLTADPNPPPGYVVGLPGAAAALIIDSDGPRPVTALLPGNYFHLAAPGPDAAWYFVEWSTNMINWAPVCTNQVVNGSIDFVDPGAPGHPSGFYRAVPLTDPPSD
jgi:hypothetical protein